MLGKRDSRKGRAQNVLSAGLRQNAPQVWIPLTCVRYFGIQAWVGVLRTYGDHQTGTVPVAEEAFLYILLFVHTLHIAGRAVLKI